MTQNWIINILRDLKRFTAQNNLPRLNRQLTRTIDVANREMRTANHQGGSQSAQDSQPPPKDRRYN